MCGMTSVRLPHMEFKVIATYNATANSGSKYTIQIPTFYPMYCLRCDRRYLLYPKESLIVQLINMMTLILPSKRKPFCSAFCHDNFPFFPPKESSSAAYSDDVTVFSQTKFLSFSIMPWWRYSLAPTENPMVRHYAMMMLSSPANGKPFGQHYTVLTLLSPAKRKPFVQHYTMMTLLSPRKGSPLVQHNIMMALLSPSKRNPILSALYHDSVTFSFQKKAYSFSIILWWR